MFKNPDPNRFFIQQLNSMNDLLERIKKSRDATEKSNKRLNDLQKALNVVR